MQVLFLSRKRFSLKAVEKACLSVDRVIVSSRGSADASVLKDPTLLIVLVLLGIGFWQIFEEIDFAAGIELCEG